VSLKESLFFLFTTQIPVNPLPQPSATTIVTPSLIVYPDTDNRCLASLRNGNSFSLNLKPKTTIGSGSLIEFILTPLSQASYTNLVVALVTLHTWAYWSLDARRLWAGHIL